MRPDLATGGMVLGLFWDGEAAFFFPSGGTSLNQNHGAVLFAIAIEVALGTSEGTRTELLLLGPFLLAGLSILANPAALVGIAVVVAFHSYDAAQVVLHVFVGEDFGGPERVSCLGHSYQIAARAEAGSEVNLVFAGDGRRNEHVRVVPFIGP